MKKLVILGLLIIGLACLIAPLANATLISVAGPNSSAGTAPTILASAPASLLNSVAFNTGQEGFDERQGVLLAVAVTTDQGAIAAGTLVNSHMIFLNKQDGVAGLLSHQNVIWTFDGPILGTMSDFNGNFEAASTPVLGAVGSVYGAPFGARGLEGADTLTISGNQLMVDVDMFVTQPGDWIRVVTAVPEPSTYLLFGIGILAIVGMGYRQRKKAA